MKAIIKQKKKKKKQKKKKKVNRRFLLNLASKNFLSAGRKTTFTGKFNTPVSFQNKTGVLSFLFKKKKMCLIFLC